MIILYFEMIMYVIVRICWKVLIDIKYISSIDEYIFLIYFFMIFIVKNKIRKKLDNKIGFLIYFCM